jgi:cupin fold WbuC family metalloprotein
MLNAIEPGSVVPIHRHRGTSETVVVLRGRVVEEYYSSEGAVEASFDLAAGGPVCALNIPAGQWHSLRALDPGTVILEITYLERHVHFAVKAILSVCDSD